MTFDPHTPHEPDPQLAQQGRALLALLERLAVEWPSGDLESEPVLLLHGTVAGRDIGSATLPLGDVERLRSLLETEERNWNASHPGASGTCQHCGGTGDA